LHMVIRAIVYADNEEDALREAKNVFDSLVDGGCFDYHTMFNTDESAVSGKARWGPITPVALADSPEGKKLIDEGMELTKKEFMDSIKNVRSAIENFTDEELWIGKRNDGVRGLADALLNEEKKMNSILFYFRYSCNNIGSYAGPQIWLYNTNGRGIRDINHLKNVLNKWSCIYEDVGKSNPYIDKKIYVVPTDVHY